jgi:hypothetical protein
MLKQPFPTSVEWNDMLRFKHVPLKLQHEMVAQTEEEMKQ